MKLELKPANSGGYKAYWSNGARAGDIYKEVDGYYVWWPPDRAGCYTDFYLMVIARKLAELNKPWDKKVRAMERRHRSVERTGLKYKPSPSTDPPF